MLATIRAEVLEPRMRAMRAVKAGLTVKSPVVAAEVLALLAGVPPHLGMAHQERLAVLVLQPAFLVLPLLTRVVAAAGQVTLLAPVRVRVVVAVVAAETRQIALAWRAPRTRVAAVVRRLVTVVAATVLAVLAALVSSSSAIPIRSPLLLVLA